MSGPQPTAPRKPASPTGPRRRAEPARSRRVKHLAAINEVVAATTSTLDLQQVLDVFLENLRRLSGADRAGVMLLDPRTDLLTAAAARDADGPLPVGLRLARGEGAAGRVMENEKPLIVPDVRRFPHFVPPCGPDPSQDTHPVAQALSYAGFPLVSRGRIIGVASLVGTKPRDFSPDEASFIDTICRATAVSIDNALAHQELQRRQQRELEVSYEKLRESERLCDSLVHMIVHDLRSPLSAITGYLEIFAVEAKTKLGPETQVDLASAMRAARNMARMINGILDVSKMEAQMMKLDLAECDLVQAVARSLADFESLIGARRIAFEHPQAPVVVRADQEIVVRIVQNLLANALRLTPAIGKISVGIALDPEQVRVFVADEGPGIPASYHRKIFDKYAQVEAPTTTTTMRNQTTGLGLAFCKLPVEAHGGRIGVDSEPGRGSTFWFTLPNQRE
ncbi:MAG: GAF domain-containing protein [Deltaproteobacteria bacterium]|nr:GAF domain-containing protein [Deltaproteobacteria bacterium]